MEKVKDILRPYYRWVKFNYSLIGNFWKDLLLYKKYSIVFGKRGLLQKEADLILNYHSLEKGMLFKEMKKGFAEHRIKKLHSILLDNEIVANVNRSQIRVGYELMCKYYELHEEKGWDISNMYTEQQYLGYKKILHSNYSESFSGVYNFTRDSFYSQVEVLNFESFAYSRKSVRNFTGEKINKDILNQVIKLANTAPSVCNRQANNVYLVEDKDTIDRLLEIQDGLNGYTDNIQQLLVLTNDRRYYYTVGERNQFYIDGGVYLMNLLYALHFYKIGNCPANWGKCKEEDKKVLKIINMDESEKIICIVAIGYVVDQFKTTLSLRRNTIENFKFV